MGYIYIITSPNGKSYIGQTIRPIEVRLKEHRTGKSKECRRIYNAIKKHGWENFVIDWYYCPDEELNNHEKLMVEVLGTLSPEGYNLVEGGGNRGKASEETKQLQREVKLGENNPFYGKEHTKENKQKISEANSGENNPNYGKTHSDETKQKQREVKLGKNNPNYGKTPSEETKQKIRKANSGENNCSSKRVYQYDLDGTFINSFGSGGEAGRHLEKDGSFIRRCARGERKSRIAYGFKWSYTFPFM